MSPAIFSSLAFPALPDSRAYAAYLRERFPPALNSFAVFLLYSCNILAAAFMLRIPPPAWVDYGLGYLWTLAVFYHLRVMDDIKDKDADRVAYPARVLSRGLVTYRQLALTGFLAIALETAIASWLGPKILALHALTLAYSLLMYKEFFIRSWLKNHLFCYGLSHMLILSCIDFTLLQMALPRAPMIQDAGFFLFASLSFLMTFSMEVARKIRIPGAELPEIDTYSKVVGVGGAMALVHGLQAAVLGVSLMLRSRLSLPTWFFAAAGAAWLAVVLVYAWWRPGLSEARSLKLDKVATLFFLVYYLALLGLLAAKTCLSGN